MASTSNAPAALDLRQAQAVHRNLTPERLIEHAVRNGEVSLASNGAVVARTGKYTGRTPKDKFLVADAAHEDQIWWSNNGRMSPETFEGLWRKAQGYLSGRPVYVVDAFAGADPRHRISVRFIVEQAWHALFLHQLLIRPNRAELVEFVPDWTVVDFGKLLCDPVTDGTRSEAVIALNLPEHRIVIFGTEYAGEMKKSIFTVMNYLLPLDDVMSMHCSANIGGKGDTALFFGLSGTGKTTLSADPERRLIGDDEHGWTDDGVFNIEGGCYAKCIRLSEEGEPEIYHAIRHGTVLENVVLRKDGSPDYENESLTENTRAAYPVDFIENAVIPSVGGLPSNIFFLTCDAFGVLPPISRLSKQEAMELFISGYTAKVAGTEAGVKEPSATFSACFAAPFLPLKPEKYARLLGEKIQRHQASVWLVNTGWSGGPYGIGSRVKLSYTRAMIRAALDGELADVAYRKDRGFGLSVPEACPDVPCEILNPRETWADKDAYDVQAAKLQGMFAEHTRHLTSGEDVQQFE